MAMAMRASVTLSIAADTTGTFSWMLREKRERTSTSRGSTSLYESLGNTEATTVVTRSVICVGIWKCGTSGWLMANW